MPYIKTTLLFFSLVYSFAFSPLYCSSPKTPIKQKNLNVSSHDKKKRTIKNKLLAGGLLITTLLAGITWWHWKKDGDDGGGSDYELPEIPLFERTQWSEYPLEGTPNQENKDLFITTMKEKLDTIHDDHSVTISLYLKSYDDDSSDVSDESDYERPDDELNHEVLQNPAEKRPRFEVKLPLRLASFLSAIQFLLTDSDTEIPMDEYNPITREGMTALIPYLIALDEGKRTFKTLNEVLESWKDIETPWYLLEDLFITANYLGVSYEEEHDTQKLLSFLAYQYACLILTLRWRPEKFYKCCSFDKLLPELKELVKKAFLDKIGRNFLKELEIKCKPKEYRDKKDTVT